MLERDNSQCLMELFGSNGLSQQPSRLRELNNCRLLLQVETLADICNPNGIQFNPNLLQGHTLLFSSCSSKQWPKQACPHPLSWGCWKSRLFKNFVLTKVRGSHTHYVKPY